MSNRVRKPERITEKHIHKSSVLHDWRTTASQKQTCKPNKLKDKMFPAGDSASAGTDVSLIDRGLFNKKKKRILTLWGNWRLQFPGQPAEVAVDSARGSKRTQKLWTLQTSRERGWEMSYCKPIKLHWTNMLWGEGRRSCPRHTHEKTPDIRDGKRQWAMRSFFSSSDFVSFLCGREELRLRNEDHSTQGDWYWSTVHKPHSRHQEMIFIFHFHVDWLY